MVLLVRGQPVSAASLLDGSDRLPSTFFLAQPEPLPQGQPCVYACQGEEATMTAAVPAVLASSDATTCVIAALVTAAAVAAATQPAVARIVHHDETTTRSFASLQRTVAGLGQLATNAAVAHLWLVGGYRDERGAGAAVARRLLEFFEGCEAALEVQLCCLGAQNTAADGSPRCTALALDLRTLTAYPAAPPPRCRGPLLPARMAQWAYSAGIGNSEDGGRDSNSGSSSLRSIHCTAGPPPRLQLALRRGRPPAQVLWHALQLLQMSDAELLQHWSTSPQHEPPHFVAGKLGCERLSGLCNCILATARVRHELAGTLPSDCCFSPCLPAQPCISVLSCIAMPPLQTCERPLNGCYSRRAHCGWSHMPSSGVAAKAGSRSTARPWPQRQRHQQQWRLGQALKVVQCKNYRSASLQCQPLIQRSSPSAWRSAFRRPLPCAPASACCASSSPSAISRLPGSSCRPTR